MDATLFVEIQAESSVSSFAQVFYDVGRGWNEKDSQTQFIAGSGLFQSLDFPLPPEPIRQLRFDPLTGPGNVVVRRIVVLDGAERQIAIFRPEKLQAANEVRVQPVSEGALIETVPSARDPITIIPLAQPLASPLNALSDALRWGLIWVLAGAVAAFILTTSRVRNLWDPRWRELLEVLRSDPADANSFRRRDRIVLATALAALALVHVLRAPRLFADPRFWAEEGNVWFQYAATHSLGATLLFIYQASGYLNLFSNVAAGLASVWASLFGPNYAPLMTTLCALIAQLLCFVFVLQGRTRLAGDWWRRILVCSVIVFSPVAIGEIWLNTINSMTYFGLMTVLILFQDPEGWAARTKWAVRGLLVIAGLTGVYSAVLAPVFVLAFLMYKSREHLYQAAVLASCFSIQSGAAFLVRSGSGLLASRFSHVTLDSAVINAFFYHVATPLAGKSGARALVHLFGMDDALARSLAVPRGAGLLLAAWFSSVLMILLLTVLSKRMTREKGLLIICFLLYSALTSVASINGLPGTRYAYLPGTLLLFLILIAAETAPVTFTRIACTFVLLVSVSSGLAAYRHDPDLLPDQFGAPSWSGEVAAWRLHPSYALRTWPSWWTGRVYLRR